MKKFVHMIRSKRIRTFKTVFTVKGIGSIGFIGFFIKNAQTYKFNKTNILSDSATIVLLFLYAFHDIFYGV